MFEAVSKSRAKASLYRYPPSNSMTVNHTTHEFQLRDWVPLAGKSHSPFAPIVVIGCSPPDFLFTFVAFHPSSITQWRRMVVVSLRVPEKQQPNAWLLLLRSWWRKRTLPLCRRLNAYFAVRFFERWVSTNGVRKFGRSFADVVSNWGYIMVAGVARIMCHYLHFGLQLAASTSSSCYRPAWHGGVLMKFLGWTR